MIKGLKARLAAGDLALGSWITLAHPAVAEIMAEAGFDWLVVDLEHSPITIDQAEQLMRVCALKGVPPLVRLTSNDANQIKRVMDCGAHGLVVPMVNSAADAARAVAAMQYPPRGVRGVGLARAQGYGADFDAYRQWLAEEAVCIVQIEHIHAVNDIDAILTTPGVDGYIVGPYDLSASLGKPGAFEDPDVVAALERAFAAGKRLKKPGGLHVVEPDLKRLKDCIAQGLTFMAYSIDTRMLDVASRAGVAAVKKT